MLDAAAASAAPAFVQQVSGHAHFVSNLTVTPTANITSGDRLVVEVGVWNSGTPTAASVTDSAGNQYVEVLHFLASDGTELSVWTAPVTAGGGTRPSIKVTPTSTADIGTAVLEYSGLSSVGDASVVDQMSHASGTSSGSGPVASGPTSPASAANELALGMYVDSGWGDSLTADAAYTQRANVSPTTDMEFLAEDKLVGTGATPNATVGTGANTIWMMATVVFKTASGPPTAPSAPTGVNAAAGNASATVSWTAPSDGGSPIIKYTITPYIGSAAQAATTITGSPPATSTTISSLTNGTSYTFKVSATNGVATGPDSAASNAVTPSATPSVVTNGGFENGLSGWTTGGVVAPVANSATVHSGAGSALLGKLSGTEPNGNSSLSQTVTVPAGSSTLTFYYWPASTDELCSGSACRYDWQEAQIRSTTGQTLASVFKSDSNAQAWTPVTFDTSAFAGQTVVLWFNVHLDGASPPDDSSMYLDDVAINVAAPPTAPAVPTNVGATAGNGSATLSWTAPSDGGSAITKYTVTPYIGSAAQAPTTVSGSPPATTTTVTGLTNGTTYTFKVSATNGIGTGSDSASSNAVTPSAVVPTSPVIDGSTPAIAGTPANVPTVSSNSFSPPGGSVLFAEFSLDSDPNGPANPHVVSVTNTGAPLTWHLKGAENHVGPGVGGYVEVWWAYNPAAQSNVTVTANLSTPTKNVAPPIGGVEVVVFRNAAADQSAAAWTPTWDVSAGSAPSATVTTTAANSLVLAVANNWDSSVTPTTPANQTTTINGQAAVVLNPTDQDTYWIQTQTASTPSPGPVAMNDTAPSVRYHMIAWEVLGGASTGPSAPGAPTGVSAAAGNSSATVSWTAPSDGGSPITSYTVTPYIGSTAQPATTISGSPPATSTTISSLTNGTTYTFTVTATNAIGQGPASSLSNSVTPTASTGGQWGALMNWPIVAVHLVLLKTGNLLAFDGWQQPQPTYLWTTSTQSFTSFNSPDSIFCGGNAQLPDGRVMVIGGWGGASTGQQGIVDTNIFDPATSSWTRVADMHTPRWYPTLTELADGRLVAISGNSVDTATWADTPEVFDPATGLWTQLTGVSTSQVHEEEYPFSYLVPNGDVFTIGTSEDKSFLLDVNQKSWTQVGGASGVVNGSSVMYRPGKILYSGGADNLNSTTPAHATTAVIDLMASTPTWRQTASMAHARIYHTLTMLADGTVLAVGGEPTAGQTGPTETSGGVLQSEIWNPATEQWTAAAPTGVTRGYHSTAVLMPDATVLVAGSGHAGPQSYYGGQLSAQIYYPAYLSNGPRPTISSATSTTTYNSTISVSTPDAASIGAVNLVSLGADTHQIDMSQHFVPLSFTKGTGTLSVQTPGSSAFAPPGNYMLFIVNSSGVPSVASFVHIAASPPPPPTVPAAPTGVTATAGNGSATVSWTAPSDGGSPITSYTVTPYIGSTAQPATTISGSPPATSTTISSLTNGTTYTFKVTATNGVGTGPASAPSNAVTPSAATVPAFVQQVAGHLPGVASLALTPASNVSTGHRLVVEVGVWNSSGATAQSVTDSAGNQYVELTHFKAADNTEMSIWTAPITAGGGTRPTITVKPTTAADTGAAAIEYAGLSTVSDATVVDRMASAFGRTSGSGSVSSGATPATTAANELALGMYVDSGFGDSLLAGSGWTSRTNVSPTSDIEFLAEDQIVATAATPAATVSSGANTDWLMATIVFKAGGTGAAAAHATRRTAGRVSAVRKAAPVYPTAWAHPPRRPAARAHHVGRARHTLRPQNALKQRSDVAAARRRARAYAASIVRWVTRQLHVSLHYLCILAGLPGARHTGIFAPWPNLWQRL